MLVPYAAAWTAFGSFVLASTDSYAGHLPDAQLHMRLSTNSDTQLAFQVAVDPSTHLCGHAGVTLNGLQLARGTDGWGSGDIPMALDALIPEKRDEKETDADKRTSHTSVSSLSATWDFECHRTSDNEPESEILTVTFTHAQVQHTSTSRTALSNSTTTKSTPIQNAVFKLLIDPTRQSKVVQVLGSDLMIAVPRQDDTSNELVLTKFTTPRNPDLQQAMVELEIVRRQRAEVNRLIAEYEAYIGSLTTDVLCETEKPADGNADGVSDNTNIPPNTLNQCQSVHCVMKTLVTQISGRTNKLINNISHSPKTRHNADKKGTCRFPYSVSGNKDVDSTDSVSSPSRPAWPPAFCGPVAASGSRPVGGHAPSGDDSLINTGHSGDGPKSGVPSGNDLTHFSFLSGSSASDDSANDEAFWLLVAQNTIDVILVFAGFILVCFIFRGLVHCLHPRSEKHRDYYDTDSSSFWERYQACSGRRLRCKAAFRSYMRGLFGADPYCEYDGEEDDEEKQVSSATYQDPEILPMHSHPGSPGRGLSRPPSYCTTASLPMSEDPIVSYGRPRASSQSSLSSRTSQASRTSMHSVSGMSTASASSGSTTMEQSFAQLRAAVSMVGDMVAVDRGLWQRIVGSRHLRTRTGFGVANSHVDPTQASPESDATPRIERLPRAAPSWAPRPMSPESTRSLYSIPPRYEYIDEALPGYETDEEAGELGMEAADRFDGQWLYSTNATAVVSVAGFENRERVD
ncbi:hypothetical protein BROUX41_000404 [Berkeleyomyces rouxiae]|uniref:uncharacterized protein n=1 Tax=Berkeleyomyces rouxiae TaxID=2035830 RepID=UPI003B7D36E4